MYAISHGKMLTYTIKEENAIWKTIKLSPIAIQDGKVEIGFLAEGTPTSFGFVDDVSLVKVK